MMKSFPIVLTALILAATGITESEGGQRKGLNLALVPSVQIFNDHSEVKGARLNVIGDNRAMTGFDLGLINLTDERFVGAAIGLANSVKGQATGFQGGLFNFAGQMRGMQLGLSNRAIKLDGLQLGFANYAHENNWLQFGVVNIANNRQGWQIGLMNFNLEPTASFHGMIFVNGAF
ncbi:MAG: hypothetical protein OSB41_06870 [Kiritimatiellae bacterium]|nr:hypothetical protein [Kiritimatiellia bacterium]